MAKAPPDSPFTPNFKFGGWKLQRYISGGGQAEVWEVGYPKGQRAGRYAVKIARPRDEKHRDRIASEISTLRAIDHPHVVAVSDHGEVDVTSDAGTQRYPYYVMPLALGTLSDAQFRCRSLVQRLHWFRQVLSAIAHVHEKNLLHRDLKPSNVLILHDGRTLKALVSDFGLARDLLSQGHVTATHEQVGSAPYMAPELLRGAQASVQSDVYALGVILAELVKPPPAPSEPQYALLDEPLAASAISSLQSIVARATAHHASDRYGSVAELLAALPKLVLDIRQPSLPRPGLVRPSSPVQPGQHIASVALRPGEPRRAVHWTGNSHAFIWMTPTKRTNRVWNPYELEAIQERGRAMLKLPRHSGALHWSATQYGFVVFDATVTQLNGVDYSDALALATRDGQVRWFDSSLCRRKTTASGDELKFVPITALKDALIQQFDALRLYLAQDLELEGPYRFAAGLQWITGFQLALGEQEYSVPTFEDNVELTGTLAVDGSASDALAPLFEKIHRSFGDGRRARL